MCAGLTKREFASIRTIGSENLSSNEENFAFRLRHFTRSSESECAAFSSQALACLLPHDELLNASARQLAGGVSHVQDPDRTNPLPD